VTVALCCEVLGLDKTIWTLVTIIGINAPESKMTIPDGRAAGDGHSLAASASNMHIPGGIAAGDGHA